MMTNKIYVLVIILILNSVVLSNKKETNEQDTTRKNECTTKEIKMLLLDNGARMSIKSFDQFCRIMDYNYCKTDSITMKNKFVQIALNRKPDSSYSKDDAKMYEEIRIYMINHINWDEDIEKCFLKNLDYYKMHEKFRYYQYLRILVEKSNDWYKYMLEMYHSIDTADDYMGRYGVYRALIDRFENTSDTSILNKVESLSYAIVNKDYVLFTDIDEYLVGSVKNYKKSKQRKELCEKCEVVFKNISETSYYKEYLRKVKKEMNKVWILKNYEPPFEIK